MPLEKRCAWRTHHRGLKHANDMLVILATGRQLYMYLHVYNVHVHVRVCEELVLVLLKTYRCMYTCTCIVHVCVLLPADQTEQKEDVDR